MLHAANACIVCCTLLGETRYCQGGCYYNGVCYSHGNTWNVDCSTKRCRQLTHFQAIVETIATGMSNQTNHIYKTTKRNIVILLNAAFKIIKKKIMASKSYSCTVKICTRNLTSYNMKRFTCIM